MLGDIGIVERRLGQEGVARHDRFRDDRTRIGQMRHLPGAGEFAADAGQIGPVALRTPLEGVIEHALGGQAIVAVALDLVAERADLLAVAQVAALADVNVAAGEFERRIGPHALHLLDGRFDGEQRNDLHQTADGDNHQGQHGEERDVLFDGFVANHDRALTLPRRRPPASDGPPRYRTPGRCRSCAPGCRS